MSKRVIWIDIMRGICMLMILWFHTEVYYAGYDIIPYNVYVANALTAFYFISGYVFVKEDKFFSWHKKYRSIILNLVLPYFFFTTILAVPKVILNHLSIIDVFTNVVLGNASWFISSLIIAELAFTSVFSIKYRQNIYILQIVSLLLAYLLTGSEISLHHNYWNFHNALIGFFFICLGYQYRCYEIYFQKSDNLFSFLLLFVIFVLIKMYVISSGNSLVVNPVNITSYPIFIADSMVGTILLISVSKRLPNLSWLVWTGQHSLVYYFFCGAVPMVVSIILNAFQLSFIEYNNYLLIFGAFLLVYALTSLITWLAYRYLKFL